MKDVALVLIKLELEQEDNHDLVVLLKKMKFLFRLQTCCSEDAQNNK